MIIGLYNLEPEIVNAAMMQVSTYHKSKGDIVEMYNHFEKEKYDKIYAFSLFNFTDKTYVTNKMTCGGTGFDITTRLPEEIEACDYDWSLFPKCEYSIVWFSRGCIRNCISGETSIDTTEGTIKMKDLIGKEGVGVYSYDEEK